MSLIETKVEKSFNKFRKENVAGDFSTFHLCRIKASQMAPRLRHGTKNGKENENDYK